MKKTISIFWFRRDLRLHDNHALHEALKGPFPVLPIFIFDEDILKDLKKDDPRLTFIYDLLKEITIALEKRSSGLYCLQGTVIQSFKHLISKFNVHAVYTNEDYEPYARERDASLGKFLAEQKIELKLYKDQVIFAKDEVLKHDGLPYTVFTPYKNKWKSGFSQNELEYYDCSTANYAFLPSFLPDLKTLGFDRSTLLVRDYDLEHINEYASVRDFPAEDKTSYLSPHLRFGTVSIRELARSLYQYETFFSELIWREFFMQILYHYPHVVSRNFRSKYDGIEWRNNSEEFESWKKGKTGYPLVDAGMRQLNESGYMHNRVRMITAGFLCKHLLIDWRWGEAYFAEKLLDYDLSSNNGNWQWAAGTGCDASPYFRIFNPYTQQKKFDPDGEYIKKWLPELGTPVYPKAIVEHTWARQRALDRYKKAISRL
ncbi:MAG: deoxyribodipyrimidine photo-lyase [Candidatus Neomarinimicrobiota bacterium]